MRQETETKNIKLTRDFTGLEINYPFQYVVKIVGAPISVGTVRSFNSPVLFVCDRVTLYLSVGELWRVSLLGFDKDDVETPFCFIKIGQENDL